MRLVEIEKKSRALARAQFGCLTGAYTINVTWGCEFGCVYCYARGYTGAPAPNEVHVYSDLPEMLARELDSPRRRSVVSTVLFNTSSDSFQTHPAILDVTYRSMKALLNRGVGVSFLTKGWIPDRFIDLFSEYPDRITARIGLVSTRPQYRDIFEPNTAAADQRLSNIRRLHHIGIPVEVRIDPVIPFFTDREPALKDLCQTLADHDVRSVSLSYLHLRPPIMRQLENELPRTEFQVLRACYESRAWRKIGASSRTKLIPRSLRQKGYRRFKEIAEPFGIRSYICACKNPDLPADLCSTGRSRSSEPPPNREGERQLSLFPC